VVLAGGRGRRLGEGVGKARVPLAGRAMIHWPLAALAALGGELQRVAVVAKASTSLPALAPGVEIWSEPDEPRHPLTGILEALRRADGTAVLVCAVDLPLVDPATLRQLARAPAGDAAAVMAAGPGGEGVQPLLARYEPAALQVLAAAAPGARLRDVVQALGPRLVAVPALALLNVNGPDDLAAAERALAGHGDQPNVNA
jgi:molybdopterin-guanine dinucleotide biosynthesis protein A